MLIFCHARLHSFLLLQEGFFFFFCINAENTAKKKRPVSLTANCLRFGICILTNLGLTNHHILEDQMQNQTSFSRIRWIFKEWPPFYTPPPTSHWVSFKSKCFQLSLNDLTGIIQEANHFFIRWLLGQSVWWRQYSFSMISSHFNCDRSTHIYSFFLMSAQKFCSCRPAGWLFASPNFPLLLKSHRVPSWVFTWSHMTTSSMRTVIPELDLYHTWRKKPRWLI